MLGGKYFLNEPSPQPQGYVLIKASGRHFSNILQVKMFSFPKNGQVRLESIWKYLCKVHKIYLLQCYSQSGKAKQENKPYNNT